MPLPFRIALLVAWIALGLPGKAADDAAAVSPWVVRTWQTEDGLPQNTVNALLQARDGFLWIGTSAGLARFDGAQFRRFGLRDGLRSVRISTLVQDVQGAIWIGTTGGGVSRYYEGRITSYGVQDGFPFESDIVSMFAGRDGTVWIGTAHGLVRWTGGKFSEVGPTQGLPLQQIRALAVDQSGVLWVSVLEEGLFRSEGAHFTKVGEDGAPSSVYSLLGASDGGLWAGEGNGRIWVLREGSWQRFTPADGLPRDSFLALASGSHGRIWISGRGAGLWHWQAGNFGETVPHRELARATVRTAIEDRSGCVWIGTAYEGLKRLAPRRVHHWGAKAGQDSPQVTSVAEDAAGSLWIGAAAKGMLRLENGDFRKVDDPAISRTTHHTYCTATGEDGTIWTAGEGCLYRFQPGQGTRAFLDPPVRGEAIRAICPDGNSLWLGTYYSTLLKCDGEKVEEIAPSGTFRGDITSIVREAEGVLWIGSSGGLHRWDRGQIQTWDTRNGLPATGVRTLARDPDGTLWIGTLGGGLVRMRDGRFLTITTQHGLIDDVISQIVADNHDAIWLGTNRGIMRLTRSEINAFAAGDLREVHPIVFGRNEGMLKVQCSGGHSPTAIKRRDGRLVFPVVDGVVEINPAQLDFLPQETPQIVIDTVLVNGVAHQPAIPLLLPPGPHRVELSYTAPTLQGGEWILFRHRLEGLERDWVASGRRRSARYDALGPGNYTFRVCASVPGGGWGPPATTFAFVVQPYWWQTWWLQTFAALAVIALSGSVGWWQMHRRHKRRIAEMERARKQQAELAHVSRVSLLGELSASLAHELNQPLTAILANAQSAIRFLSSPQPDLEEVRASLVDIAAADRRASEVIRGMRSMIKKGDSQMRPCDLNEEIMHVLLLLKSDLIGRHVTVTTILAPNLPLVLADAVQLQQVVMNLLMNGADAMRDHPPHARQIVVCTRRNGDGKLRVSVTDRGPGIPPDMLASIFEPFISTKRDGLGMGLAICRAIIDAHGGQLRAQNEPQGGATFLFTLRVATGEDQQMKA